MGLGIESGELLIKYNSCQEKRPVFKADGSEPLFMEYGRKYKSIIIGKTQIRVYRLGATQ